MSVIKEKNGYNLNDLTVNFDYSKEENLLEAWKWLIGEEKHPILISGIGDGDMFLQNEKGEVFWLDIGRGELIQVANSVEEFKALLEDEETVREWFLVELVAALKRAQISLGANQVYGYKPLPMLGGEYSSENLEPTDIEIHFQLAVQIHEQMKDLQDGTQISKVIIKD